uniref:UBC core domain-containing protein n=1 Tax=Aplanochytrium stocchinoi TaxID=215587 RepID=A0A7S3PM09_9STRA
MWSMVLVRFILFFLYKNIHVKGEDIEKSPREVKCSETSGCFPIDRIVLYICLSLSRRLGLVFDYTYAMSEGSSSNSNNASGTCRPKAHLRPAMQRLMSDLKEMSNEPPEGCSAAPVNEQNLFLWNASIIGPEETPWEGGIYGLRLQFPEIYPSEPPRVQFTCEMYHPNVYSDGTLCLDIIQKNWSPIYTTSSILTSIQSLLTDPNPESPANTDAAKLFETDKKAYRRKIRKVAERSLEG